ncbi:MAG: DNA polymerase III subunit delta [Clostridia bacterium]|nr:DNA polymerase III subunit delta [Clostridia bacterium]
MAPREAFGISVSALKARLRDDPCGAFAFFGMEEMLKQFYLQKYVTLIEKEGSADFNLVRLDFTRDHTVSDLLDESQILPFCGERRLVICRGLNPAKMNDGDVKRLMELLENFPPYLILILYLEWEEFQNDKATLKKKSVRTLAEKLTFVSFPLQEERVLLPWCRKILGADGLSAPDGALRTLFRFTGNRMQTIRGELEKLSAYAHSQGRTEITQEDVLLFAQDSTEFAVYHLCDAVLEGAVGAVEQIFANLKRQEVEPVMIAASLSRMLTNALLIAEGADAAACQKATALQAWQFERYRRLLFGKKKEALEKALFLCLELDGKLKGFRSDSMLVTEVTVLQMARLLGKAS